MRMKSAIGTSESAIVWWSSAPGMSSRSGAGRTFGTCPGFAAFRFPHVCPSCGQAASRLEGEVAWRCVNVSCPAMIRQSLAHFVSKAGLDIEGLGQRWIELLVASGRVKTPADLFTLRVDELLHYERMGVKLATKFVDSLDRAKKKRRCSVFFARSASGMWVSRRRKHWRRRTPIWTC